jgi:ferritin-like metal-binding protein YciE
MKTLRKLVLDELSCMYDSEHRITQALPKLIKAATCHDLQHALQHHLKETEGHVTTVGRVFGTFNEKPQWEKSAAIAGLLEEGDKIVAAHRDSPSINAAIIAAAQKVEHYEIACYGTLLAWSELLENEDAAQFLQDIIEEEKAADGALNDLADFKNQEAFA